MPSYNCRADVGDMRYHRQNYSLPERLDPPDAASECAICRRDTEDGRDIELCDEAVDALHDAALVRLSARIPTGKQFVCESCLDDLHAAQERHRAEAFDTISDALGLDEYEHPALRARKVVAELQRLQSSPAPVAGGVPELTTNDLHPLIEWVYGSRVNITVTARNINAWFVSRLPSIKPGEVVDFDLGFVEACAILAARPFDQPTMARNIIREGGVEAALLATKSDYVGIDILRNEMRDELDALRAKATTTTEKEI